MRTDTSVDRDSIVTRLWRKTWSRANERRLLSKIEAEKNKVGRQPRNPHFFVLCEMKSKAAKDPDATFGAFLSSLYLQGQQ